MITLNRNALILLDGFLNFEYKHKVNVINLYTDVGEIFENPSPAINYLDSNDCGLTSSALITALKNNYINSLIEEYNVNTVLIGVTLYIFLK